MWTYLYFISSVYPLWSSDLASFDSFFLILFSLILVFFFFLLLTLGSLFILFLTVNELTYIDFSEIILSNNLEFL